uniref:ATP-binding protein n=1 Tax=Lachnoclostridium phocaeense TaxID=1871021 RepID=UPI003FA5C8F6
MKEIKRGEIYSADFGVGFGSEQGGVRPVLILQNNTGNKHSPTTIVAAITGRSEVHIDIFDDRLVVYSPGGMPDGTKIQERNIDTVPSTRRNPVLADIFSRLGYMERQGSGLNKIRNAYRSAENYTPDKEPVFYSDRVEFTVTLKNLNFSASENEAKSEAKNEAENYRLTELEERLCNLLLEYPELTQSEIRERLDLSRSKVQRMMRKLTEDGIIIREGSRRKGYWTIHL